jgi:hypothetical protein
MDAVYHARSCVRKWGGTEQDYLAIHEWFDETSAHINDLRHRLLRHHSQGVAECIRRFGRMLTLANGRQVPVKQIAERHIVEDLGFIPSLSDWVRSLKLQPWMMQPKRKRLVL